MEKLYGLSRYFRGEGTMFFDRNGTKMEQIEKKYLKFLTILSSYKFYSLDSGSSVRTDVRVRVSPSAPYIHPVKSGSIQKAP